MRRIVVGMTIVCAVLGVVGCKQGEQKQQPMNYSGAPMQPAMPSPMRINELQDAAKMAPNNSQAWVSLGDSLMDSKRFGEAVEAYQKGLAIDPKNVNARVDMGTCYRGVGQFEKAIEEYRKAIKQEPNHPNAHRNLGVVLSFDMKNTKEGLKEFQKYVEIAPNSPEAESVRQTIQELKAAEKAGK